MKIVLINHSYQVRYFFIADGNFLAQVHPDLDVTLLAPKLNTSGTKIKITPMMEGKKLNAKVIDENNFSHPPIPRRLSEEG
ncbi:MAG: hypothetical protein L6V35_00865 [Alistipes putredinis]|nr:MAG: hypothetical protein L6V35_00865 [Alistipes putredinis]